MPSQKTRSKEDTWTTDELNKALDKTSDRRRPRDRDEERKRDRINGEEKSRRHRDEDSDRRHSRHKDDDNGREVRLTEEERERQREERRRKKEGKDGASSKDRKGKEIQFRGKSDNRDIERKDVIENDEDDRQTRHRSDRERERRHHDDGERERRHHDREQRHKDNDDADRGRQRRHRDEDNDRDKRRKPQDEDDREKRRKHGTDNDEDERERQRIERRRERESKEEEDRRKRSDDKRDRRKDEDRKKDRDKDRDRHRDRDEDRSYRHKDRRDRDRHHKENEKDKEDRREREREERRREREERHKEDKKSSRHKEEEEKEEEEDEYNYEEDFEDYEEDFEEDEDEDDTPPPPRKNIQDSIHKQEKTGTHLDYSDSEVNDVLRALDAENERLLNSSSRSPQVSAQPSRRGYGDRSEREQDSDDGYQQTYQPRADRPRTAINFVSAKQRAVNRKTANKTMQRGRDLLQMLELDYASFDIMDLPPVNEYDLYIRAFGSSDTRQAYVQTNDDNVDRDIQTEEIDARNKWTQHPPDDFKGCGRGDGEKDVEDEEDSQNKQNREQDLGRLNKFLEKAGQVIAILLEEGKEEEAGTRGKSQAHITVSEGYTQLDILPLLQGRHVTFTHFSPVQPNLLLAVYSPSPQVSEENPVSKRGIICVWNTNEPSYPQKILVCSSQPRCCCFSPVKPSLVFAGMVDGSIAMWDLREPSSIHQSTVVNDESYSVRYPTYDTASVLKEENHHSPVTSILPIYSYIDVSKSENQQSQASEDTSSGLSFQLVSTEESAVLNFWVVAEIGAPELAGSESDLGLAPGAGVKLLKSSTLTMSNPSKDARLQAGVRALDMALMPNDPNHLYVATDAGSVLHGIRFGKRTFPRSHGPLIESIVDVVSIDFSPFDQPCFLAGCADGTFSLYNTKSENPVISWPYVTKGRPVQCVRWSRSRPSVFYVLDVSSTLYVFDLLEGDTQPKNVENISKEKITSFSLTTDQRPDGLGPSGKDAQMLFSYEDGRTEIHTITKSLRVPEQLESDYLASYLYRF